MATLQPQSAADEASEDVSVVAPLEGERVLYFDPTTVLMVSLFLLLFAFFAAMNAMTKETDNQTYGIFKSLGEVFDGNGVPVLPRPTVAPEEPVDPHFHELQIAIAESFAGTDLAFHATPRSLEVFLPLEPFFLSGRDKLGPSKELLLKTLASEIAVADEPMMRVSLGFSPEVLQGLEGQQRAAMLAATLTKYGLGQGRLAVVSGVSDPGVSDPGVWRLLIERVGQ